MRVSLNEWSRYGPNSVATTVRGGQKVQIRVTTDYPFAETVHMALSLSPAAAETEATGSGGSKQTPLQLGVVGATHTTPSR